MIRWILATAIMLVTVSCCTTVDTGAVKQELMNADKAFAADSAEQGLDGWMKWFTKDAVIFPQQGPTVRGEAAMRQYYADIRFDPTKLSWAPVDADVSDDGTVGHTWGTWQYTVEEEDGTIAQSTGKYLTAWHRQADGSWRVTADMGIIDAD